MLAMRIIILFLAAYASLTTFAFCEDFHEPADQVWKVGERRWTLQEENDYGKWIETEVTEDFFIRHQIRVDCADVPYALRWIYARIYHLPAAATTGKNRMVGHWSRDWARFPTNTQWDKDQRFRAALMYVLSSTSTRTLPFDTYPIYIAADSVTPGTTFLLAEDHAGIVSHIVMDGSTRHPVQTLEAGSPSRIQRMQLRNFILPDPGEDHVSGFVKFRWPIKSANGWHYLPVKEHPFYSEEQYTQDFTKGYIDYIEAVEKRIDPKIYDPNEKVGKIINTLVRRLNQRIPVVLEGQQKCPKSRCPEESPLWEIYSTPVRDEFIGVMIEYLEDIIKKHHLDRDTILDKMANIELQISPGRSVSLRHVFENFKWMSSDPEAAIEARWGLDKCSIIAIHLKTARDSISFIQKKYGKTDPRFAERSIWPQQKIVDEMTKESRDNHCNIR